MASADEVCPHCGLGVAPDARDLPFCCPGCRAASALLQARGLGRYYDLRRGPGVPVAAGHDDDAAADWLEAAVCSADLLPGRTSRLTVDLQGVHCAACVWVIEHVVGGRPGVLSVAVNPTLGRLHVVYEKGALPARAVAADLVALGYRAGPAHKQHDAAGDDLLLRLSVTAVLAMNAMILSAALYFGLSPADPVVYRLFTVASPVLCTLAVLVGGTWFFRRAWRALRQGAASLDLPIAAGILLSYAGSAWAFVTTGPGTAYFDTVTIFTALMLFGRLLERRLVERNRRALLQDEGVDGLRVRRLHGDGRLEHTASALLRQGDVLMIAPGELVPLRAQVVDASASCSLDWVTGEPEPKELSAGDEVPAGAHNAARRCVRVIALEDFAASRLHALLARRPDDDSGRRAPFWSRLSRGYVAVVLGLAAAGFALWLPAGLPQALSVVTALLVVTCPCAIGIAIPLADELAVAALRHKGVFVRATSFLDRVRAVRTVLLDKTGTLTLGELVVADDAPLRDLGEVDQRALWQLAARSNHPKSRALLVALERVMSTAPALDPALDVVEEPGRGVRAVIDGVEHRLGSAAFATGAAADGGDAVVFARGDVLLARLRLQEELRHDARLEVARLRARGLAVHIVSGDAAARVQAIARSLGLPASAAHGDLSPEDKAAFVAAVDHDDTLMIGDGVNDALAFGAAFTAGTPAVDRPQLPARADFYLVGTGLGPLCEVLATAERRHTVVLGTLALAFAYNAVVVGLALAGRMSPVLCAVLMPTTSVIIVASTAWAMSRPQRAARARSPPSAAAGVVPA